MSEFIANQPILEALTNTAAWGVLASHWFLTVLLLVGANYWAMALALAWGRRWSIDLSKTCLGVKIDEAAAVPIGRYSRLPVLYLTSPMRSSVAVAMFGLPALFFASSYTARPTPVPESFWGLWVMFSMLDVLLIVGIVLAEAHKVYAALRAEATRLNDRPSESKAAFRFAISGLLVVLIGLVHLLFFLLPLKACVTAAQGVSGL